MNSTAKPRSSISTTSIGTAELLGGISGFTVKRAPREALLRGLGGDATRLLYTLGWHEVPIAPSEDAETCQRHLADRRIQRAGGSIVPGCIPFDRANDSELLGQVLAQAHEKGMPYLRHRVAQLRTRVQNESTADADQHGWRPRSTNLLGAVHTAAGRQSVKLPGGLWIVTERAVATESGEPVDPVQAALWGLGRTILNEEPGLRSKLVDCRRIAGGGEAADRPARHTGRRAGTGSAPRESLGVPVAAVVA